MQMRRQTILAMTTLLCLFLMHAHAADIPIKSGQSIAFLGDSITAMGSGPRGYCAI